MVCVCLCIYSCASSLLEMKALAPCGYSFWELPSVLECYSYGLEGHESPPLVFMPCFCLTPTLLWLSLLGASDGPPPPPFSFQPCHLCSRILRLESINLHLHIKIISVKSIDDDLLVLQQDSRSSWYWQWLTSNVPTMSCNSFSYINPIHEAIFWRKAVKHDEVKGRSKPVLLEFQIWFSTSTMELFPMYFDAKYLTESSRARNILPDLPDPCPLFLQVWVTAVRHSFPTICDMHCLMSAWLNSCHMTT